MVSSSLFVIFIGKVGAILLYGFYRFSNTVRRGPGVRKVLLQRALQVRPAPFVVTARPLMKPFDISQPQPPQEMMDSHFSTPIIIRLVEKLYESSIKIGKVGLGSVMRGKALRLVMGGTATELGGQGLAKCIRIAAVKHAEKKGFNSLLVEAGHPATAHIWSKYVHARKLVEIDLEKHVDSVSREKPWEGTNVGNMTLYTCVRKYVFVRFNLRFCVI